MGQRAINKRQPKIFDSHAYADLLENICFLIEEGRRAAARHINSALIITYWRMGKRIVVYEQKGKERAEYGKRLLKKIAKDLMPRYGKGFSERNLELMRKFYLSYPVSVNYPISQTLSAKSETSEIPSLKYPLSWSHYSFLLRIDDIGKREFYEQESSRGNWSLRQLNRQVQAQLYERVMLSRRKEAVLSKAHRDDVLTRPEDEIKDTYVLDFLGLKDEYSESDLEKAIIDHLENFLLELGLGFAFIARQKVLTVDGEHFRIDLLFFHRILRCAVLIEVKICEFDPSFAGKMNFYLNCAKREIKLPGENDPIGIILCAGKKNVHVEYALGGLSNKIFVSQYRLRLPKPEELQTELEKRRDFFIQHHEMQKSNEMPY